MDLAFIAMLVAAWLAIGYMASTFESVAFGVTPKVAPFVLVSLVGGFLFAIFPDAGWFYRNLGPCGGKLMENRVCKCIVRVLWILFLLGGGLLFTNAPFLVFCDYSPNMILVLTGACTFNTMLGTLMFLDRTDPENKTSFHSAIVSHVGYLVTFVIMCSHAMGLFFIQGSLVPFTPSIRTMVVGEFFLMGITIVGYTMGWIYRKNKADAVAADKEIETIEVAQPLVVDV